MSHPKTIEEIQNFQGKYPRQLWYLFLAEMWERFSFYGMRGMLTVFMTEELFMKEGEANLKYGAIQAFVYTLAFVGGLFADKILGFRKSIFWGGLLMIAGSFILAFSPEKLFFFGISFTIVGTGFFKPNISTMVGTLYKAGDPRRDAGFSLFYSGINIGAFLGGFLCIYAADNYSWNLAFSLAGIFMILGLAIFAFTQKTLGPIGLSPLLAKPEIQPNKARMMEYGVYALSLAFIPAILMLVSNSQYSDLFMYIVGPCTLLYLAYEMTQCTKDEILKLLAAMVFIFFSILFWAFFEQSGGSLALFARNNLEGTVLGFGPSEINNSANALFVIAFSPLIGLIWLWMAKKKIEPNSVVKFGLGFIFLAAAFYTLFMTRGFANANGMTSIYIFIFAYLIMTIGELCLSPIGLSLMTKLSPKRLFGVMMGMWFLASAYGQYAAGILGAGMASPKDNATNIEKLESYTTGYHQLAVYALVCGAALILISPLIRKLMGEVK